VTLDVVDAQIHLWAPSSAVYPWSPAFGAHQAESAAVAHTSAHPNTPAMFAATMDEAGVAAALVVPAGAYGTDNRYCLDAAAARPDRFRVVGKFDPRAPRLDDALGEWAAHPATAGIRVVVFTEAQQDDWRAGVHEELLAAAEAHGVPVCLDPPGLLDDVAKVVANHPHLDVVIDHLGGAQPPLLPAGADPFAHLPALLALAELPAVTVKLTGLPTLSADPHPYADLWPVLHRVVDAFGADRLLWGSDWARPGVTTPYADANYLALVPDLTADQVAAMVGGTARRVFRWPERRRPPS
jgi:predicted TIM-barrel fold metal-dependent hydrolase